MIFIGQSLTILGTTALLSFVPVINEAIREIPDRKFWLPWVLFLVGGSGVLALIDKRMRESPMHLVLVVLVTAWTAVILATISAYIGM